MKPLLLDKSVWIEWFHPRSIGAELWTLNQKDFQPFCRLLHVTLGPG